LHTLTWGRPPKCSETNDKIEGSGKGARETAKPKTKMGATFLKDVFTAKQQKRKGGGGEEKENDTRGTSDGQNGYTINKRKKKKNLHKCPNK